jgi:hypothetical protein
VKRTAFSDFVREELANRILHAHEYDPFDNDIPIEALEYWPLLQRKFLDDHGLKGNEALSKERSSEEDIVHALEKRPALCSSRAIQQWWGQDFRRAQDPLYWIKKSFLANAEFILESGNNILIEESCRQQNEGHYVQALGGVVLDLKPLPSPTKAEGEAMSHSVEQAALSWVGDYAVNMAKVFGMEDSDKSEWLRVSVDNWLRSMDLPRYVDPNA